MGKEKRETPLIEQLLESEPRTIEGRIKVFTQIGNLPHKVLQALDRDFIQAGLLPEHVKTENDTDLVNIRAAIMAGRVGDAVEQHFNGHTRLILDSGSGDNTVIREIHKAFISDPDSTGVLACDPDRGQQMSLPHFPTPDEGEIISVRSDLRTFVRGVFERRETATDLRKHKGGQGKLRIKKRPLAIFKGFDGVISITDMHHAARSPDEVRQYMKDLLACVKPYTDNDFVGKVILVDTTAPKRDWERAVANAVACSMDRIRFGGVSPAVYYPTDEEVRTNAEEIGELHSLTNREGGSVFQEIKEPNSTTRERHSVVVMSKKMT